MTLITTIAQMVYLLNALLWLSIGYGVYATFGDYIFATLFLLAGIFVFPPILKVTTRKVALRVPSVEPVHLYAVATNIAIFLLIVMGITHGQAL